MASSGCLNLALQTCYTTPYHTPISNQGVTMRFMLVLLYLLVATSASAVIDPDTNSMGFYFDVNADVYEYSTAPYLIVPVHVILTRPDFDALFGYDFSYEIIGNHMVSGTSLMGEGPICACDPPNFTIGLQEPLATSPATLLCTLSILVMDAMVKGASWISPSSVCGSV